MLVESVATTRDWNALFAQRGEFSRWFADNAYLLDSPAMLLGDEMHTVHFDWDRAAADGALDERYKIALVEVNPSPFASCTAAIRLFYQQLHEYNPTWVVERAFCPVSENNRVMMEQAGVVPVSVEGRMPLASFDVLCFSQQMIGDEVGLLYLLKQSGIPMRRQERTDADPIIIRGGSASFNPSLIMDVCDLFFIGEGEDYMPQLLELVEDGLAQGHSKEEILLKAVTTWDCLWAPCFYEQRFSADGELLGTFPLRPDVPERIRSHHVVDLDRCFVNTKPIASFCFHSSAYDGTELTRGCDGQCSFCVSGFVTLPFRARSVNRMMDILKEKLHHTGDELISLTSFSSTSYPHLNQLMCSMYGEMSLRYKSFSQRIDSFGENPEFCRLLPRVGNKRAVFGVEGISQRLRQAVSKNCSEEQILRVARMACRDGYETCKLMFIAGLPGETEDDWEELVSLAEKIQAIRDEEARAGNGQTVFVFSWTPLRVFPFTPFQWLEARMDVKGPTPELVERLEAHGVVVSKDTATAPPPDVIITQLLLRGDSRLQGMLIGMAENGLLRHAVFTQEALDFADAYMAEHGTPDYSYWFGPRDTDAVFPWDFLDYGPTKEHLRRRYEESVREQPSDFPRCTERCQGCGTCTNEEKRTVQGYLEQRRQDARISLESIGLQDARDAFDLRAMRKEDERLQFGVVSFTHDAAHRMVHRNYWENELARALNYAGIAYDRKRLWVNKPYLDRFDWAVGENAAVVGFAQRHEAEDLLPRINEHCVNMRVTGVEWHDTMPRLKAIRYRIPLEGIVDERGLQALQEAVDDVLAREEWTVSIEKRLADRSHTIVRDVRPLLFGLGVDGDCLRMEVDPRLAPYTVLCSLANIDWAEAGRSIAVREGMRYE